MGDIQIRLQDGFQHIKDALGPVRKYVTPTSGLVGLGAGLTVYWLIKRNKYRLPPGPPALPLIGNYSLLSDKEIQKTCAKLADKYGPVITIYLGPVKTVILNTIEVTMEALVKKKGDFANRPVITSVYEMSEGGKDIAFSQYTPTWKLHRKIAGSALRHYLKGERLERSVHGSLTQVIDQIEELNGKPFVPHSYIDRAIFNIICGVCFQKVYKFDDPKFQHLIDLDNKLTEMFGSGFLEDLMPILRKVWPTKRYLSLMAGMQELLDFIDGELQEHKKDFDPGNIRDFADTLILARREAEDEDDTELLSQLTDVHLRQTLTDIFFAGFDTTRFTIMWALLHLADQQDMQKKAQAEIDRVVGRDRLPGLDDRVDLPYTEALLHEIMRASTVVPFGVPHAARVDSTINGYDVPKGTMVMINHWALHNDPRHWKDPAKFDPERYLDSDGRLTQKPESWLPFSAGRRVCLGESAAKPELVLILAIFLHQFNIRLPPGVAADYSTDMSAASGNIPKKYEIIAEKRV